MLWVARAAILACVLLALLSPPSSAKQLVVGVGQYRVANSSWLGASVFAKLAARAPAIAAVPRLRVLGRRNVYRPRPLRPPLHASLRGAHTSSVGLYTGAGFPGLTDNGFYPADAQLAVGPQDIVEMTNTMVGVYGRDGLRLSEFPMSNIFGGSNNALSDPQIAWDPTSDRWLAAAMNENVGATIVAVSTTADPLAGWWNYTFDYGSTLCPDQPRLGFSSLVVVVATELFDGSCHSNSGSVQGGVVLVASKADLLAGLNSISASQYGPDPTYSNYVPVQMLAPSDTEYFASVDQPASSVVHVFDSDGVPPNDTLNEADTLLISTLNDPTYAAQRGGGVIDAGDDRVNDATWQNGVLYLAADDQCSYADDPYLETCARLIEISTGGTQPTLIGENDIGFDNGDAYYAALRPDANGNVIAVFGYSSEHDYPSVAAIAAVGPITGEQGGNFTPAIELAGGTNPTIRRWGDYQGAAVDPTNPLVIWTAGQVADNLGSGDPHRWATHIDSLSLTGVVPPPLPHQVDPGYLYRGHTSQNRRISIRPSGGGGHIATASITIGLRCGRGSDAVSFDLINERRQAITAAGHFHIRARFGADSYATSYAVTISGRFTPGWVTGTASASEYNRTKGNCQARGVSFSIHD